MTTEPITPDAVRALIAEAVEALRYTRGGDADLVRRLSDALSASLPREDADLGPKPPYITAYDPEEIGYSASKDDIASWAFDKGVEWGEWSAGSRTVETAEELWGVVLDDFGSTDYYDTREEADEARKRAPDTGLVRVVTTTIVPTTPEEPDRD